MGGAVKGIGNAIGDVVGGVGGIASGVAGAIPGIGPYIGPVVGGITGGPVGFATSLAGNALQGNYGGGGGGGGEGGGSNVPMYAKPEYNYGNQTYQYGNNPVDASKYFVTGDRGVYNLMPALGQITPKTLQPSSLMYGSSNATDQFNKSYFTPYEAYQELSGQMKGDPKALAAFQSMYQPTTPTSKGISPYVDFGLGASIGDNQTYADLAKYAATNQNPFYLPYKGTASGGTKMSTFTAPPSYYEAKKQKAQQKLDAMTPYERALRQQAAIDFKKGNYMPYLNDVLSTFRSFQPKPTTPTPVAPRPVTPTPVRPRDNRPRDNRPTPVAPTPVTPAPVAPTPTPVTPPSYPGIISTPFNMAQGGIATLRRK